MSPNKDILPGSSPSPRPADSPLTQLQNLSTYGASVMLQQATQTTSPHTHPQTTQTAYPSTQPRTVQTEQVSPSHPQVGVCGFYSLLSVVQMSVFQISLIYLAGVIRIK